MINSIAGLWRVCVLLFAGEWRTLAKRTNANAPKQGRQVIWTGRANALIHWFWAGEQQLGEPVWENCVRKPSAARAQRAVYESVRSNAMPFGHV